MSHFKDYRILARLVLVAVFVPLLGISAGAHDIRRELRNAQQSINHNFYLTAAGQMAAAAHQIPDRADLWESAGHFALSGGDDQAAIKYFETAAPLGLSPQGLLDFGDAYQKTGNLPAAVQSWKAAEDAGASRAQVLQRLWQAQLKLDDIPAAIQSLQSLITLKPEDAQLNYQLGLLVATQHPNDALDYLTQAAQLDPSLSQAADRLKRNIAAAQRENDLAFSLLAAGRTLASLDEWDLAATAFQQAVQERPDYAEAWAFLGEARQHLPVLKTADTSDDGLPDLQKAVELIPSPCLQQLFWQFTGNATSNMIELCRSYRQPSNSPHKIQPCKLNWETRSQTQAIWPKRYGRISRRFLLPLRISLIYKHWPNFRLSMNTNCMKLLCTQQDALSI